MNSKLVETTISIDNKNKFFLEQIKNSLAKPLKTINGLMTDMESDRRYYVSLAYPKEHKPQMNAIISENVAKVISVSYKRQYLLQKMRLSGDELVVRTLINTMCIFDSHIDSKTLSDMLGEGENIVIDGVYNFRSKAIKRKWDEIIELSNANDLIFSDKEIIKDFLRFLLEAVPIFHKKMYVVLSETGFLLLDAKSKNIPKQILIYPGLTDEEILMYNIICQKPRAVVFVGKTEKLSAEFVELADYLFETSYENN